MPENNSELDVQLEALNKEIAELRARLNSINAEKESWFRKKEEIGKKISELISKVKTSKTSRNSLTKDVKEAKVKRDEWNKKVAELIGEANVLKKQKDDAAKKSGMHGGDVSFVKSEINKLEYMIETQAVSFEKEKQLMKQINDLKKKIKGAESMGAFYDKMRDLNAKIKEAKDKAEEFHKVVRGSADEGQKSHEEVISFSKEVDALKLEEDAAYKKFFELKNEFRTVNDALKEKLLELRNLGGQVVRAKAEVRKEHKKTENASLSEKIRIAEEKFKNGDKLTTDDLLALQARSDN